MPLYIIPQRYALRGATAAELAARNEVLLDREFCQETDTGRFKLGDGSTRWLDLPYAGWGGADLTDLADGDALIYDATLGYFVPGASGGVPDATAASVLLGRGAGAGAGPMQEITLGTGMSMSGTVLSSTGTGVMSHVGTAPVAGSAATSLTISGLDLATDNEYHIEFEFANATASASTSALYFNGDTTATNYWRQSMTVSASSVTAARANNTDNVSMLANSYATGRMWIKKDRAGKVVARTMYVRAGGTNMILHEIGTEWQTVANLTTLTFTFSVASSLAIGSVLRVYKVSP